MHRSNFLSPDTVAWMNVIKCTTFYNGNINTSASIPNFKVYFKKNVLIFTHKMPIFPEINKMTDCDYKLG